MKKRIGKFFIILGVIFFCLTPFYCVKAEDTVHYNVVDLIFDNDDGVVRNHGQLGYYGELLSGVAHNKNYHTHIDVNLDGNYRGGLTFSVLTDSGDYIIASNCTITSASVNTISIWLHGSDTASIDIYSVTNKGAWTGGIVPQNINLFLEEKSASDSRNYICDALDTSNDNTDTLIDLMTQLIASLGTDQNVESVQTNVNLIYAHIDDLLGINADIENLLNIDILPVLNAVSGYLETVESNTTNIYDVLLDIAANQDFQGLSDSISHLETVISNLSNNITVTNNIDLNSHDIPFYQYLFLTMLTRNSLQYVNFDDAGEPFVYWGDVKNNTFTFNPGTGTSQIMLCYYSTDANLTLKVNNTVLPRFRGVGNSNRFANCYDTTLSFGNHTVNFVTTSNNGVINDQARIYPIYLGKYNFMPNSVKELFGLDVPGEYTDLLEAISDKLDNISPGTAYDDTDLLDKLDDILNAIHDINLSVDYQTINQTVNNFNTDISIIHDTENNILTSFNTYNDNFRLNSHDLNYDSWFSSTLFNYVFEHFWVDNSSFAWIITLILFCVLIVALVGLGK